MTESIQDIARNMIQRAKKLRDEADFLEQEAERLTIQPPRKRFRPPLRLPIKTSNLTPQPSLGATLDFRQSNHQTDEYSPMVIVSFNKHHYLH